LGSTKASTIKLPKLQQFFSNQEICNQATKILLVVSNNQTLAIENWIKNIPK